MVILYVTVDVGDFSLKLSATFFPPRRKVCICIANEQTVPQTFRTSTELRYMTHNTSTDTTQRYGKAIPVWAWAAASVV
jgi:hypothetical protein